MTSMRQLIRGSVPCTQLHLVSKAVSSSPRRGLLLPQTQRSQIWCESSSRGVLKSDKHRVQARLEGPLTYCRNGLMPWRNLRGARGISARRPEEKHSQTISKPKAALPKVLNALKPNKTKHENIYTVPNILTFSRLIAAPVVGFLVLHDYHAWAFGLFAYAGITDLIDGWIARKWHLQTVVGTVIDPMADKTLMTILTVCLAIKGALPVWLAFIILGRDTGLAISAIYYRYISLPPPKTFARYWDFSLPSAEVHPTTISKYNTALQLALIGATTALPLISADLSTPMTVLQYIVATTTIWSGASYIYSKDAVKILNQAEIKNKQEGKPQKTSE